MRAMIRPGKSTSFRKIYFLFIFGALLFGSANLAAQPTQGDQSLEVMRTFTDKPAGEETGVVKIADKKRHQILFVMGVFLLVGVLTTASLGIAMVLFGKRVFVAHMIFAGITSFLAIAHSIVAIVWFFPY